MKEGRRGKEKEGKEGGREGGMEGVKEGGEVKETEGCLKGPSLFHLFSDAFIHTATHPFKCIDHWTFFNTIILDANIFFLFFL